MAPQRGHMVRWGVKDSPQVQTDSHRPAVWPTGTESDHIAQDMWAGSPVGRHVAQTWAGSSSTYTLQFRGP